MLLQTFDAGLNTRLAPHLIKKNEAVEFTNIDVSKGTLTSVKNKVNKADISGVRKYGYYFEVTGEWYFLDEPTSWVEIQERLYWTNSSGMKKLFANTSINAGILAPVGTINSSVISAPSSNTRLELAPSTGSGDLPFDNVEEGTFEYYSEHGYSDGLAEYYADRGVLKTFKSSKLGAAGKVTISGPDTNFQSFTDIYRSFDGVFRKVGRLTSVSDTLVDDVYDISGNDILPNSIGPNGTIQYALTYYNSVDGVESAPLYSNEITVINGKITLTGLPVSNDIQVDKKRLYRIGGNITTYTRVTTLENNETTYTDTLSDTELEGSLLTSVDNDPPPSGLLYLTEHNMMLFGAVEDKLHFTPIGQPDAWPSYYYLDFPKNITGLASTASGLIVMTRTKSYLVTGSGPLALAQQPLSIDQGCISHFGIAGRASFVIWPSTDGICMSRGGEVEVLTKDRLDKILFDPVNAVLHDQIYYLHLADGNTFILDFPRNVIKYDELGITSLITGNDTLYGHREGVLYELYKSEDDLQLVWTSPEFIAGRITQKKAYKNIYISHEGEFVINVYLNKKLVNTKYITGTDVTQIKIDSEKDIANRIQLSARGTGTIDEIHIEEANAND